MTSTDRPMSTVDPTSTAPEPLTPLVRAGLETALASWIPRQRWCAVPAGAPVTTRILAETWLTGSAEPLLHLIVVLDAATAEGATDGPVPALAAQVYQVPLVVHAEPQDRLGRVLVGEIEGSWVYDGLHDAAATPTLLDVLDAGTVVGALRAVHVPGAVLPLGEDSVVIGAEQSNTSLVFGEAAIVKVFRRLWPGANPDIEVSTVLTEAGSTDVPPLLASLSGSWPDPADPAATALSGGLAMASNFLRTATDGWELALGSVRDLLAEEDLHADEVGGDFAAEAHRLGAATAKVHEVLAEHLPTGELDPAGLAALADVLRARLDAAVSEVPALAELAADLGAVYDRLAAVDHPVRVQRVHGDFHLGQTMRTSKGWRLLDFEGEPGRPIAERVVLDSPLRDVAGMLRSLDYASRQPLMGEAESHQLAYRAAEWRDRNGQAFCEGYVEAGGTDIAGEQDLVRAYEADKAVYEAVYENNYRPSWLPVPLAALRRLAAGDPR